MKSASEGCTNGHQDVLKAPAGYNPSYASGTVYGPWNASVTCSNANRVAASGSEAASAKYEVTIPIYASK